MSRLFKSFLYSLVVINACVATVVLLLFWGVWSDVTVQIVILALFCTANFFQVPLFSIIFWLTLPTEKTNVHS